MKKTTLSTILSTFLLIIGFAYCYAQENDNFYEPYTIQYMQGYYPIPNNPLGMDMFMLGNEKRDISEDCVMRLTEQQKQGIWQKCLSHQRAAQANIDAAEKQSIMVPDKPKRELISSAIKTLVTSMAGRTLKEKAAAIAITLAAEYLAAIYEQYDKIQVYLEAAEEQYRLAGQCLDILSFD